MARALLPPDIGGTLGKSDNKWEDLHIDKINGANISDNGVSTTSAAGLVELATSAEVQSGGDATRGVTPAALKAYTEWRPSGMKNLIINGNFDIWQRGTSFSENGYTADRWNNSVGGSGGTQSVSSENLNNISFLRLNRSAAGTSYSDFLAQYIEFTPLIFEKTCTLSFKAKGTDGKNLQAKVSIYYGSGGSPNDLSLTGEFSLTGGWERYSFTFTFPSGEGKSIGTNPYFYIYFRELSGFSTFVLDLSEVQLELGSVATPFEQRPIGLELALCQRYYWKQNGFSLQKYVSGANINSERFPVPMRATPTMAIFSQYDNVVGKIYNASTSSNVTGAPNPNGSNDYAPSVSGGGYSVGDALRYYVTASAEL